MLFPYYGIFRARGPGFLSRHPNWVNPPPHPQATVPSPPGCRGETYSLAGEGVGGPNSDDWPATLVLMRQHKSLWDPFHCTMQVMKTILQTRISYCHPAMYCIRIQNFFFELTSPYCVEGDAEKCVLMYSYKYSLNWKMMNSIEMTNYSIKNKAKHCMKINASKKQIIDCQMAS